MVTLYGPLFCCCCFFAIYSCRPPLFIGGILPAEGESASGGKLLHKTLHFRAHFAILWQFFHPRNAEIRQCIKGRRIYKTARAAFVSLSLHKPAHQKRAHTERRVHPTDVVNLALAYWCAVENYREGFKRRPAKFARKLFLAERVQVCGGFRRCRKRDRISRPHQTHAAFRKALLKRRKPLFYIGDFLSKHSCNLFHPHRMRFEEKKCLYVGAGIHKMCDLSY